MTPYTSSAAGGGLLLFFFCFMFVVTTMIRLRFDGHSITVIKVIEVTVT